MGGGLSKHSDEIQGEPPVVAAPAVVAKVEDPEKKTGCPMHQKDGSYSYDWTSIFRAAAVHGPKGTKPLSKEEQDKALQQANIPKAEGGCPVKHDSSPHPEYNVYSQPIDKSNQMPKGVKTQLPAPTQKSELSTNRVASTIPKGGGDEATATTTWTYPSPQQFYNALVRKGKLEETSEDDIASVVALHNNMNEKTWAQVVEWEKQTYGSDSTPKLLKFQGRPHDLSPKALLKHYVLGHPLPYDRHDWTVLRDNGVTVRYVIDYYYDESRARDTPDSALPDLQDRQATPSLLVDVRPALDGPSQLLARAVTMPYSIATNQTSFSPLPLRGTAEMMNQVQESIQVWHAIQQSRRQEEETEEAKIMKISESDAKEIATSFAKVLKQCQKLQQRVQDCESEEDCGKASMDLTICMGQVLCQVQHKTLVQALGGSDDDKIEAALETLTECVMHQTTQRHLAKEQHPQVFKK